jgi:RND family efflux transporter MFP subunit
MGQGSSGARRGIAVVALMAVAYGCGGDGEGAQPAATDGAVTVSAQNILVIDSARIESGPSLSGTLQPRQSATIAAQMSAAVTAVVAETGQEVAAGAMLARLDDTAVRDGFLSARSAVTTAEQSAALADRDLERSERLAAAGAIAERDLEAARIGATAAAAQLADARARLALATDQVADTEIRAPIRGVVAQRSISTGDIVQPGMPLFTVVDPTSMRLEAFVPAAAIGALRREATVEFTVNGYPGRVFAGSIERISPTADAATGMVTILVSIPNAGGDLVGGLFAEGRVATVSRRTLVAPLDAIDRTGGSPSVLRISGGIAERVPVVLGLTDEGTETIEIVSGVSLGDTLLLGAAQGITPGSPVVVQAAAERSN